MTDVVDNTARSRFELQERGLTAFADYRRRDGVLVIPHVEAPIPLRGTGTSGRLMAGLLALARSRGEKVLPLCSYAASWIRRHAEYHDLLDN